MSDMSGFPTLRDLTEEVWARRRRALDTARPAAVERQHARGRWTARERLARLCDADSFQEMGILAQPALLSAKSGPEDGAADGVVTGFGQIAGRWVACAAFDATVQAGTLGITTDKKLERLITLAIAEGVPLVLLVEGTGGRITERMGSFVAGGHERFFNLGLASGWIPIVVGVVGPTYAGHANIVGMADFVVMRSSAVLAMAGPALVEAAIGQAVAPHELGGARIQAANGAVDAVVDTEEEVLDHIRAYLRYMPDNASRWPDRFAAEAPTRPADDLLDLLPDDSAQPYDMHDLLTGLLDGGQYLELKAHCARSVITALGRIEGYPVGILANNPAVAGGMIDALAAEKLAHAVSLFDAFNLPLVFLVDVPGYMVGVQQERGGIIHRATRPLIELAQASVPRFTVIVRKAYGLAYHTMGGTAFAPDLFVVWPSAEMSLMGADAAAHILARGPAEEDRRRALAEEFARAAEPWAAAAHFRVDDIIDPRETRTHLAAALHTTWGRPRYRRARPPKKHPVQPI